MIFIATANSKDTIPEALLDRMEVIDVVGYTTEEKTQIALRHLLPRLLKESGLSSHDLTIPEPTIVSICELYTREPGVRSLERQIAAVCRATAVRVVEQEARKQVCRRRNSVFQSLQNSSSITITPDQLVRILGAPFYQGEADLVGRLIDFALDWVEVPCQSSWSLNRSCG